MFRDESFKISWFPGHMAKSLKKIQQVEKFVDFWFEVVDARAPFSSRGQIFDNITKSKPRVVVLKKSDLADDSITNSWITYFKSKNILSFKSDKTHKIYQDVLKILNNLNIKKKFQRKFRAAVIGVPNVGKSCFINNLVGKKKLKVENRAGVTRDLNWISCGILEICDTPGILTPKIDSESAKKISYLGLIKSEILDFEELALNLIKDLEYNDPPEVVLSNFASSNGCKSSGGNLDLDRASRIFIKKFQSGQLGKISLETPQNLGNFLL